MNRELSGRIDITKCDRDALEAGYLVKVTMLNKCPKEGQFIAAIFDNTFTCCQIYHKERIGFGPPGTAYRVIFGAVPEAITVKEDK